METSCVGSIHARVSGGAVCSCNHPPAPPPRHVLGNAAAAQGEEGPPPHSQREEHSPPRSATVRPRIHSAHRGRDDCVGDLGGALPGCDTQAPGTCEEWRLGVGLKARGSGTGDSEERGGSRRTQQGGVAPRWKVVDPVPPGPGMPTYLGPMHLPGARCTYLEPMRLSGIWHTHLGRCTHLEPVHLRGTWHTIWGGVSTWDQGTYLRLDAPTLSQCIYLGPMHLLGT